jgi:hypothetical protein
MLMNGPPGETHGREGSSPDADPLLAWREQFPILKETNYLISNSLGAVPARMRIGS